MLLGVVLDALRKEKLFDKTPSNIPAPPITGATAEGPDRPPPADQRTSQRT